MVKETIQGSQSKELLGYLKEFEDEDVKHASDADPKAAGLLSRLLQIETHKTVITMIIIIDTKCILQAKSRLNQNEILLQYLSRFDDIKEDDTANDILARRTVSEEHGSVVSPTPEPDHERKTEPKGKTRALPPLDLPRGLSGHMWNALSVNEIDPEPEIQPTSDDNFLKSIHSATRSPSMPAIVGNSSVSDIRAPVPAVKSIQTSTEDGRGRNGNS